LQNFERQRTDEIVATNGADLVGASVTGLNGELVARFGALVAG
jgi:hypothetical protein